MSEKSRKVNLVNALMLLLLLASVLAVATSIALDSCILPHTGNYVHPSCKVLAFLTSFFISIVPAIFLVVVLTIADESRKSGVKKNESDG
jgi:hypothetical protein